MARDVAPGSTRSRAGNSRQFQSNIVQVSQVILEALLITSALSAALQASHQLETLSGYNKAIKGYTWPGWPVHRSWTRVHGSATRTRFQAMPTVERRSRRATGDNIRLAISAGLRSSKDSPWNSKMAQRSSQLLQRRSL